MDARALGVFEGGGGAFDVFALGAGEGRDARLADFFSYCLNTSEVAVGRDGKAGFKNVHPEVFERMGHGQLFVLRHAAARGLFAIAKGGIKEKKSVLDDVWSHIGEASTAFSFANAEP